ncbi:hypothetical protein EMIT0P395_40245 [Pseudomonas sp. IT-P395]
MRHQTCVRNIFRGGCARERFGVAEFLAGSSVSYSRVRLPPKPVGRSLVASFNQLRYKI